MLILLDSCVWGGARGELVAAGHDVIWTGDWPEDPGDEDILARAHAEGRIVVTLDKDFGELAIVRGIGTAASCDWSTSPLANKPPSAFM